MRCCVKYMVETLRLISSSSLTKKSSRPLSFLVRLQVDDLELDPDPLGEDPSRSCLLHTNVEGHPHWKGINHHLVHPSIDMLRHSMVATMDVPRHRTVTTLHRTVSIRRLTMAIGLRLLAPMVIHRLLLAMRHRLLIQVMAHRLQAVTVMDLLQVGRRLPVMVLHQVTVVMGIHHLMDTGCLHHLMAMLLMGMARHLTATAHHLLGMAHMDMHLRMPLDLLRIVVMIRPVAKATKMEKGRQEGSVVPAKSVCS